MNIDSMFVLLLNLCQDLPKNAESFNRQILLSDITGLEGRQDHLRKY